MNYLLIDDNEKILIQLQKLLLSQDNKAKFFFANTVGLGYRKIKKNKIDIIFCDITIHKRLAGFYLLNRINKNQFSIILMSTAFDNFLFFLIFKMFFKNLFGLTGIIRKKELINNLLVFH